MIDRPCTATMVATALLLALVSLSSVHATQLDEKTARLVENAKSGDLVAQKKLGDMYFRGYGVPKDFGKAVRWYWQIAKSGDTKVRYKVGMAYESMGDLPAAALCFAAVVRDSSDQITEMAKGKLVRYGAIGHATGKLDSIISNKSMTEIISPCMISKTETVAIATSLGPWALCNQLGGDCGPGAPKTMKPSDPRTPGCRKIGDCW